MLDQEASYNKIEINQYDSIHSDVKFYGGMHTSLRVGMYTLKHT